MDTPVILPQPQTYNWIDAPALPLPQRIVVSNSGGTVVHLAAERLAAAIAAATGQSATIGSSADGQPAFYLRLQPGSLPAEGYRLGDDGSNVELVAAEPLGISHAVETARQLVGAEGWPRVQIEDWPVYQHRGIYVESFWGTDLMERADWRAFIDYLVSLKFNTLNVGLHGCWEIKYNGVPTEFLMVALHRYPQLSTPQTIRYLDPPTLAWVEKNYLPRSAEADFLPEVFAYARARGLRIVPQFGGPGHNTMIPRLLPELSAKKVDGSPTGYGYCLANPATWKFLRNVIDEVVERYCRPFDVTHFNIAGDEVYPIRNVLPAAPQAEVSPWCACPQCRTLSEFEQLTAYLFGLAEHLAGHGIRAVIWADTIDRMGKMAEFKQLVVQRALQQQVVIQWWCYKEPLPELSSAPQLETWVEPSPGLVGSLLYQDFSRNIYGFLQRGRAVGATGVTAYNVPDWRLDKNYACLAEFAWNTDAGSIPHFAIRYAQHTYGAQWRLALEAYDVAERIMGCYPLAVYVMDQLLHYFNNFPHGRVRYPLDLLRTLAGDPLAILTGLRVVAGHMTSAEQLLTGLHTNDQKRDRFILECRRYRSLALAIVAMLDSLRLVSVAQAGHDDIDSAWQHFALASEGVQQAHDQLATTLVEMTQRLTPYLQPSVLREYSALLEFLGQICQQFVAALAEGATGGQRHLPALPLLDELDLGHLRAVWHPWEF